MAGVELKDKEALKAVRDYAQQTKLMASDALARLVKIAYGRIEALRKYARKVVKEAKKGK